MAPRKTEELIKKTMNFRKGDFEYIALLFPTRDPSVMVRRILSTFVDRQRQAAAAVQEVPEGIDINLDV